MTVQKSNENLWKPHFEVVCSLKYVADRQFDIPKRYVSPTCTQSTACFEMPTILYRSATTVTSQFIGNCNACGRQSMKSVSCIDWFVAEF